jgi:UDP:flavonoid glycosyltransferase YjiC (YdhE family)
MWLHLPDGWETGEISTILTSAASAGGNAARTSAGWGRLYRGKNWALTPVAAAIREVTTNPTYREAARHHAARLRLTDPVAVACEALEAGL